METMESEGRKSFAGIGMSEEKSSSSRIGLGRF